MKTIMLVALLLAVCPPNVFAQEKNKKEKICITEQELGLRGSRGRKLRKRTSNYPFSYSASDPIPNISPDAVADYNDKNSKTYLLRCVLRKDLKKKKLKTSYGGTKGFSRIGFNRGETEALVYTSWSGMGNTCESDFYYLRKEDNKWKIVKKVVVVIC